MYKAAVAAILVLFLATSAFAVDNSVTVSVETAGNANTIIAQSSNLSRFTVTLDVTGANIKTSQPVPISVDSIGQHRFAIVVVRPIDPSAPSHFSCSYHWMPGGCSTIKSTKYFYSLPYASDKQFKVEQGFLGSFSHYQGSGSEYAVDWSMPVGTVVCACRGGVVVGVRVDSSTGGPDRKYMTCANYIVIDHLDGTFGEYLHLSRRGSYVTLGQKVETGQPIGLSGNTGFSSGPHLHFSVFHTIDGTKRLELPFKIQTRSREVVTPIEGDAY